MNAPKIMNTPRPVNTLLKTPALALLLAAIGTLAGCVSTDYVGKSYAPTAQVDLYFSDADVQKPYEAMGEVRVEVDKNFFVKSEKMQKKLLKLAREKGADGVIVAPMAIRSTGSTETTTGEVKPDKKGAQTSSTTTTTAQEVKELRGLLIKYNAS